MVYTPPTGAGNVTTNGSSTGNTLTVNKPSNLANGDLLVIIPYKQLGGTTFTTPTGFTQIYRAVASGTRGLTVYARPIGGSNPVASEPASYNVVSSDTSNARWLIAAFRLPGLAAAYLDAAPTSDTYATNASSITDPAVTAIAASTIGIAVNFNNNSNTVYPTFTSTGWTGLANVATTAGSGGPATSVLDVQYKEFTAAGSTGSATFVLDQATAAGGGFLFTLAIQPQSFSSAPALTGTGTLTVIGSAPASSTPVMSGGGTLTVGIKPALAASPALSGAGRLQATGSRGSTDLDRWLNQTGPKWCAHRNGFYATYGEFTVAGFQALAAYNPKVAWNIDVFKTSDGEWVASHDQTTGRVLSGTSLDIPSSTWSSISGKTTLVGGNPVSRIDDIVAVAPAGTIFFVDNKQNANTSAFFAKLTALGLGPGNVVNKNFVQSTAMLTAAKTAGYTTWAYAFDASAGDLSTNAANYDWAGFDYAGTQSNWNTAIGTGKPSFAHIIGTTGNKTSADTLANTAGGSNFGYMVSAVSTVVSPASAPSLAGSGTLTTAANVGSSGTAALAGAGSLTASTVAATGQPATFTGTGTLTAAAAPSTAAGATFSGSGQLAASAGSNAGTAVALTGAGTLAAASVASTSIIAGFSGVGALVASSGSNYQISAALAGGGTLTATGKASVQVGAALAGSGALTATVGSSSQGVPSFGGGGTLATMATLGFNQSVTLSGVGALTAAAVVAVTQAVGLNGGGSLAAVGQASGPASDIEVTVTILPRRWTGGIG